MTRFLFSVWQLRISWYGAPSLTRGWVCNLLVQLLLGLARAVTLGSKSRRTHDHILLSHLRLPQLGGPGSRIYIPQEHGGPVIALGTGSQPGGPGPCIYIPRNMVTKIYPRAMVSLSVASYDTQDYGGDILTLLHMRKLPPCRSQKSYWSWSWPCGRQSVDQFILVSGSPLWPMTRIYLSLFFSFDS
jgi:hypothetical protein